MKRLLLITLMVLSHGPAYAEWESIGTTESETVYIDLDTIRRKGDRVKLWHLHDSKVVQTIGGSSVLSFKIQSEIDCPEERVRKLARLAYSGSMGGGKVVYKNTDEWKWEPIAPDSTDYYLSVVACVLKK